MKTNESDLPVEGEFLGLDVGDVRIGVARINSYAKIAEPLPIIKNNSETVISDVLTLADSLNVDGVVIGVPRGLDGQETAQTAKTRAFITKIREESKVSIYEIDEAGSTKEAEKRQSVYPLASLDSLAAVIILEDFINVKNKKSLKVN